MSNHEDSKRPKDAPLLNVIQSILNTQKPPEMLLKDSDDDALTTSKVDFAQELIVYQVEIDLPAIWCLYIFNKKFDEGVSDCWAINALAKKSKVAQPDYARSSLAFLTSMKEFWAESLIDLQDSWHVEPLDLAVMAYKHQLTLNYKPSWSYFLLTFFFGEKSASLPISELQVQAQQALDCGDVVKLPFEFQKLIVIKHSTYLTDIKIESLQKAAKTKLAKDKNNAYLNAVGDKLKAAASAIKTRASSDKTAQVELTDAEIKFLLTKMAGK